MKIQLIAATAAFALLGGAAMAQDKSMDAAQPAAGSMAQPTDTVQPATSMATDASTTATDTGAGAVTTSTTTTDSTGATVTTSTVTNGPVPDTPENRARYGQPMSHAGKLTKAQGN